MITININGKDYELPTSWEDINLNKYEEIQGFLDTYKFMGDTDYWTEFLRVLTGCPMEDIDNLNTDDFSNIKKYLKWSEEEVKPNNKTKFNINNQSYMVETNFRKMKTGQRKLIESIIRNDEHNAKAIMAALLLPSKKVYDSALGKEVEVVEGFKPDEFQSRIQVFGEKLNYVDSIHAITLFLNFVNGLSKTGQDSSTTKNQTKKQKTN